MGNGANWSGVVVASLDGEGGSSKADMAAVSNKANGRLGRAPLRLLCNRILPPL